MTQPEMGVCHSAASPTEVEGQGATKLRVKMMLAAANMTINGMCKYSEYVFLSLYTSVVFSLHTYTFIHTCSLACTHMCFFACIHTRSWALIYTCALACIHTCTSAIYTYVFFSLYTCF